MNNFNKIKNKKIFSLLKIDSINLEINNTSTNIKCTEKNSNDPDYGKLESLFDKTEKEKSIKYQIGFIFALFYNYIDQIMMLYGKIGKSTENNNNGINNISKMIKNTKNMFLLHVKACLINKYNINKKLEEDFIKIDNNKFDIILEDDDFDAEDEHLEFKNFIIPLENKIIIFNDKDFKIKFMNNLVEFLSNPVKNTNIGCGSLIQNGYVYNCSLKEIISFCAYLYKSKNLVLKHINNQLDFISKGVPIKDIYNIYHFIYKNLERISRAPINMKEIICSDFIAQIKEKYENNRKRELKYTNEDYLYQIRNKNESNIRKIDDEDYVILDTTRIHYGLLAEMIKIVTPKVIEIFKDDKPTSRNGSTFDNLCDGLDKNISLVLSNVDEGIKKELAKIIEKKQKNLGNKYLKKNNKNMLKLVSLDSIPKPSEDMYKKTLKLFNISGINGTISKGNSKIKNSSKFDFLSNDLVKKITTVNFWQLILSSINGRTIYLPIYDSVYKNIYLFDVLNSLALSKIIILKDINKNTILNEIVGKGYILLTDTIENLNNESKWKLINDSNFTSKLKKKNVRLFLFNLIANDLIFNNNYNNYLSPKTNTSKLLRSFCKSIYKLQFSECSILISREQFGKGVQKLIKNINYLKGINFEKGNQYADIMHVISTKNDIFRK